MAIFTYNKRIKHVSDDSISVQFLKDNGILEGISYGFTTICGVRVDYWCNTKDSNPYFRVSYNVNERKYLSYPIKLEKTPCNFGGYRFWFICPLEIEGEICGRRVGILYYKNGVFGCRKCQEVPYKT